MRIHALVDYDNVKVVRERNITDVTHNLESLFHDLVEFVKREFTGPAEVHTRLYGGWRDEEGSPSRIATWILAKIGGFRGLRSGIRVLPSLALSPLCYQTWELVGTVRLRARPVRQKMVDSMMTVDAMSLADNSTVLMIISDDDDMVPGCIGVSQTSPGKPILVRRRMPGTALNDHVLAACGVPISVI